MRIQRKNKGFTLIEVLLVITAIGIFSAIGLVALNPNKQLEAGRAVKRKADMDVIAKAIEQYVVNNRGKYPPALQSVVTGGTVGLCVTSPCTGGINLTTDLAPYVAAIPLPQTGQYTITKTATGITPGYDSSTIWATAGTTAPTLDLNFARDKQLVNAVNGSNPITFARNSIGTYVGSDGLIKTAAVNEPRFDHDPVTKSSLGLLVEEGRTNSVINSADFTNASWTKTNTSITPNIIVAPDGTNTASKLAETATTGVHEAIASAAGTSTDNSIVLSVFAKAAERNFIYLRSSGNSKRMAIVVDLTNGNFNVTNWGFTVNTVGTVTPFPNGWYRITITAQSNYPAAPGWNGIFIVAPIDSYQLASNVGGIGFSYTGISGNGVYIWGAQSEVASFSTSYIPTTTAAATRQADNASITGANFATTPGGWYNPTEGTVVSNTKYIGIDGSARGSWSINDGSGNNEIGILQGATYNSGQWYRAIVKNGVNISSADWIPTTFNPVKIAISYGLSGVSFSHSGLNSINVSTQLTSWSSMNKMQIGLEAQNRRGNIHISRLTYWPTRLSNTTLTNITK
jgi:prepilin-type N-terminal cleavage/methylation domain-containing protein